MRLTALAPLLDGVVFGRAYRRLAGALCAFAALLLPSSCVVCGRWDTSLCPDCLGRFRTATVRPYRAEAGAESLPDVDLPAGPAERPGAAFGPLPVLAAGRYGRTEAAVLLAFKNHGHVDVLAPVAAALGGALHAAVSEFRAAPPSPVPVLSPPALSPPVRSPPVLLVPVPTRASSRRRRGYDPLMLLLSRLDRGGRLPAGTVVAPAVRHLPVITRLRGALARGGLPALLRTALPAVLTGVRGGQKGLGRRRRRTNVMDSMGAVGRTRGALAGRECIIVDDVLTTGATIGEVHRVLTAQGARVLGAVVVAATSPPAGGGSGRVADAPCAPPPGADRRSAGVPHRAGPTPPQVPERGWVNKGQG